MNSNNVHAAQPNGKQRVLVNVILDKSGSMSSKVKDVIGGFNLYLDELGKEVAVEYGFSLTLFDSVVDVKCRAVPLAKVAKLDDSTYRPSGNTALLDAIGNTIETVKADDFGKIITVIMTDGEENSSRQWSLESIRELITTKEAAGNWTFVFLGATLDAFAQGNQLGVSAANSVHYDHTNYRGVYTSLAEGTNALSSAAAKTAPNFFKADAAGIAGPKNSRAAMSGHKKVKPASSRKQRSPEKVERLTRELNPAKSRGRSENL